MSCNEMAVLALIEMSDLTAESLTIEHVDCTTDLRVGSVGKLAISSGNDVPIYCAIDSPQGR